MAAEVKKTLKLGIIGAEAEACRTAEVAGEGICR
jgi:hypothetical protein